MSAKPVLAVPMCIQPWINRVNTAPQRTQTWLIIVRVVVPQNPSFRFFRWVFEVRNNWTPWHTHRFASDSAPRASPAGAWYALLCCAVLCCCPFFSFAHRDLDSCLEDGYTIEYWECILEQHGCSITDMPCFLCECPHVYVCSWTSGSLLCVRQLNPSMKDADRRPLRKDVAMYFF